MALMPKMDAAIDAAMLELRRGVSAVCACRNRVGAELTVCGCVGGTNSRDDVVDNYRLS